MAACAQATIQKPHGRARSSSEQASITRRSKKSSDSVKKSMALGYRRSKSMTNLNAADVDTNPYTGQVRRTNPSLNASISALDLPLPNKPMQMSTPYGHGQNDFLSLDENVAYTTNRDIDSRPPFPPPYSMSPPQSHLYEQLDVAIAESSAF